MSEIGDMENEEYGEVMGRPEQEVVRVDRATFDAIRYEIESELTAAQAQFPTWPVDLIHRVAIVAEEAGEAVRASLHVAYDGEDPEELYRELVQTAATAFRAMASMRARGEVMR